MTTALASLSSVMLVLSWQSDPGITYTIQTSDDLFTWESLPYVMEGNGTLQSFPIDRRNELVFARLRSSADGDTNENGLPDRWEWEQFGYLDIDPNADFDSDGHSNYIEWLNQTNPLDYFNGELAVIHLSCGTEWLVPSGQVSNQALSISVFHADGNPWEDAPVTISLESGIARILTNTTNPTEAVSSVVEWTDPLGRIHPAVREIHILAPNGKGSTEEVIVTAGSAIARLIVRSTGTDFGLPPRQLKEVAGENGKIHYVWSGDPDLATAFLIQEKAPTGEWRDVIELATVDLPQADPLTGIYTITLNPSLN